MAGRGTDIILGGNARGVVKSLAKYLMLTHLNLLLALPEPTEDSTTPTASGAVSRGEALRALESDADVLALPSLQAISRAYNVWLPLGDSDDGGVDGGISVEVELELRRAVVSVCDALGGDRSGASDRSPPTRLDVEVETLPTAHCS